MKILSQKVPITLKDQKKKLPSYAIVKLPKMPIDENFNPDKGVSLLKTQEEEDQPHLVAKGQPYEFGLSTMSFTTYKRLRETGHVS